MDDLLSQLLVTLDLQDAGARTSEDLFTGASHAMPSGRIFGGQVFAQSVVAAQRTIAPDRFAHSAHAYFLRPGDVTKTLTFAVDRIFDGRSFSTRHVGAFQEGRPIFSLTASFQDTDPGLEHQLDLPEGIPGPEGLDPSDRELSDTDRSQASWLRKRPFELRHVEGPIYLTAGAQRTAHQAVWMRAAGRLPDDPNLHRAVLAYASDFGTMEPVMRRHGLSWSTPGLKTASLDHAIWWHRQARVDDWLLLVIDGTNSIGGRGFSNGRFYTREGVLVASIAQEGMLRVPQR